MLTFAVTVLAVANVCWLLLFLRVYKEVAEMKRGTELHREAISALQEGYARHHLRIGRIIGVIENLLQFLEVRSIKREEGPCQQPPTTKSS